MNTAKVKISRIQLFFLIVGLIHGSILATSDSSAIVKHDSWLLVLSGLIVTLPFAIIYTSLSKRFPRMNLIQIHNIIYGRYLGKIISILYIYYFLMVLSFNIRILGDFYVTFFMSETPLEFFIIVFILICGFTVYKGIEILARISHIFVTISIIILVSTFLLLLKNMNFSNLLPIFDTSLRKFIQGTHIIAAVPLGEIMIFLMVTDVLNNSRHLTKITLLGLFIGAMGLLLITLENTAILGGMESILTSPSFQTSQLIDLGQVFTRMDFLFGIGLTLMLFLKCSLFYYVTIVSLRDILSLKTYVPLILPIGGITFILAMINWDSSAVFIKLGPSVAPIFITPILFIFPPLSLFIAQIRNLPKK